MNCPKCDGTLQTKMLGDVEVDQCSRCQGIWLDLGELPALQKQKLAWQAKDTENSSQLDRIQAPCPRCGGEGYMTRLHDLNRPDLVMDSCAVCYGIWLDAGELDKLTERSIGLSLRALVRDLLHI